ncbi:KH domain-containing protein [Actinocrispum sp. NPDC049592]|uniref:KH domain-containing protein n=1 Tax=Actinocrispum sp. NPDC049592 TaxID=3154835 RepID=UPI003424D56E
MTDDSAFKKQVRARMAETGEKYTEARRMVLAGRDPGRPPEVLRVYLRSHVDLELTDETASAYATADEQGRQLLADRLLAGSGDTRLAVGSQLVTSQDAAIRDVVLRATERAVGVSAVEIGREEDHLRVDIRAARPILLAGPRGAEADRLRGELEELTGRRVRLNIWEERSR